MNTSMPRNWLRGFTVQPIPGRALVGSRSASGSCAYDRSADRLLYHIGQPGRYVPPFSFDLLDFLEVIESE